MGSLDNTVCRISNGTYTVDIGVGQPTASVTQDSKKKIYQQSVPRTKSNWTSQPQAKQSDFLLIETTFTIEGFLTDDGTITARTKQYQLEQIFRKGGNFNFTYSNGARNTGQTTYTVNCTSWRFKENAAMTDTLSFTCVLLEGTQR